MEKIHLARKALGAVKDESFSLSVYADTGWNDIEEFYLKREEILYLLKERLEDKSLFEGLPVKAIDLEEKLNNFVNKCAWPDGGPRASVNSIVPLELKDLDKKLEELNEEDKDAVFAIRENLKKIEGGTYTFSFTVTDAVGDYYFDEDAEEPLQLSKEEVLGLFLHEYGYQYEGLFDGICKEEYDEEDLNDIAQEAGFALDYDNVDSGCHQEPVDCFLESWTTLIEKVISGELTEEQLPLWLSYFDPENVEEHEYENDIEIWAEEI